MSRPSKFHKIKNKLEKLYKSGKTDKQVAEKVHVSERAINRYKKKNPKLRQSIKDWKKEADEKVERSLYERAMGYTHTAVKMFVIGQKVVTEEYLEHYPPDSTSLIFWLKNRQPEKWRDKTDLEHTGSVNLLPPITIGGKKLDFNVGARVA